MGFKDELNDFKNTVLKFQECSEPEIIDEEDVVAAFVVLNYIKYEKVPDIFLGCAAANLLNTYIKQENTKINYQFRRHLENILKGIEDVNQTKTIKVFHDDTKKSGLLMIVFWDFQFSFHAERATSQISKIQHKNEIEWDGIRKQLCAKSIFNFALKSTWIKNETLEGRNLCELVEQEVLCYKDGGYKFIDGQLIKQKDIVYGEKFTDVNLKNYFREQLKQCSDRPVILTAKFKRIWDKHITFTTVRPYIKGCHTYTICDHINLFRPDVEKVYDISELESNRKYYIIGFCTPYLNGKRMGVKLALDYEFKPLYSADEFNKIPIDVFSECHRFSIEKYLRTNQKHLKL